MHISPDTRLGMVNRNNLSAFRVFGGFKKCHGMSSLFTGILQVRYGLGWDGEGRCQWGCILIITFDETKVSRFTATKDILNVTIDQLLILRFIVI